MGRKRKINWDITNRKDKFKIPKTFTEQREEVRQLCQMYITLTNATYTEIAKAIELNLPQFRQFVIGEKQISFHYVDKLIKYFRKILLEEKDIGNDS